MRDTEGADWAAFLVTVFGTWVVEEDAVQFKSLVVSIMFLQVVVEEEVLFAVEVIAQSTRWEGCAGADQVAVYRIRVTLLRGCPAINPTEGQEVSVAMGETTALQVPSTQEGVPS